MVYICLMRELTRILHDLDQGNKNKDEAEELIIELFRDVMVMGGMDEDEFQDTLNDFKVQVKFDSL